ncbi:MAG: hypothetical protein U0L42_06065 [Methanobrevibacter sp.]|uniref:hypothetical protein n=1 Tax=Methanobrevibacter sp. TaxID=66852 RepID=UPI002E79ADEE|nr:hypothetical protein [Methanobrevibacter sp.]MEE0935220.1 hypothetical protein [Methanobrevibacter sp.]
MELQYDGWIEKINKFNYRDLIIFLIPVIIFSVYLSVFFPGIATLDSFDQLHQIASSQFSNWHPFFHTFIEMLCLKVYPSPMSVGIFQILVFSIMWMIICKYNRDDNVQFDNTFKLQVIFSVVICLIPINALYSITLWKDILFSYFLMFSCFLVKVMIDREGVVNYKFIILFSLIMAFIAQIRGNGMYVILVVMVIYSIYLLQKNNRKMAVLLPILTITFILLIASLNVAYDVEDNEKDAVMAKIAHMLADYDLNLEVENVDINTIHKLIDSNNISENYNPTGSDKIYNITNSKVYEADKSTYISLAIKYSLKYPLHFLQYLFSSSPMVWDITRDDDWLGSPYYMSREKDNLHWSFEKYNNYTNHAIPEKYENISYVNWGTPVFEILNFISLGFEYHFLADTMFNSPALYMYLSIIFLILIHIITKSKDIYLMYIPNFLNILIVFFSTPVQDNRYLYANLLVCYLLIIILIGVMQRFSFKSEIHKIFK